jgi:F0F1-type ATP synthase alpha subunit
LQDASSIIGDRQTGKTALAIDAVLSQRDTGVICVYNAIWQKQSTIAQVVKTLEQANALRYSIVVAAGAADPPGHRRRDCPALDAALAQFACVTAAGATRAAA